MTTKIPYFLLPLILISACTDKPADDTSEYTDTSQDSGTDTDTDTTTTTTTTDTSSYTAPEPVCGELEEATTSMAIDGTIETDSTSYLVCSDSTENETCPDYIDLPSSFVEDSIGNPWGSPYCWYGVLAACGPETSITDRCCYEFIFQAIACA